MIFLVWLDKKRRVKLTIQLSNTQGGIVSYLVVGLQAPRVVGSADDTL